MKQPYKGRLGCKPAAATRAAAFLTQTKPRCPDPIADRSERTVMATGTGTLGRFVSALRGCGVQPSDRVAVALSGGPDSLALAAMTVWWHGFTRSRVSAAQPAAAACAAAFPLLCSFASRCFLP